MTRLIALFLALLVLALLVTGQPSDLSSRKLVYPTILIEPSIMTATATK